MYSIILTDEESHIAIGSVSTSRQIKKLGPHIYSIAINPDNGQLLLMRKSESFTLPPRLYGDHSEWRDSVIRDYEATSDNMGALANGLAGSGKSLLSEAVCNELLAKGYPVIIVTAPIPADIIKNVLLAIGGNCVVYFDEFGKVYDKHEDRGRMLPLFSDTTIKHVLFIVTSNYSHEFAFQMLNRPGRFRYHFRFAGVTQAVADDLYNEFQIGKAMREVLNEYVERNKVSFDIMRTIVAEAAKVPNRQALLEKLTILNVPMLLVPRWNFKQLSINEEVQKDAIVEMKLLKDEDIQICTIDKDGKTDKTYVITKDTKRVEITREIPGGQGDNHQGRRADYRFFLGDGVSIELMCYYAPSSSGEAEVAEGRQYADIRPRRGFRGPDLDYQGPDHGNF